MAGITQYTGAVHNDLRGAILNGGQSFGGSADSKGKRLKLGEVTVRTGAEFRLGKKLHKVLEWIHQGPCNHRHIDIQSKRKEGTGQWIFKAPQFQQWMNRESRVLLGCGIRE